MTELDFVESRIQDDRVPLTDLPHGVWGTLVSLDAEPEMTRRLAGLGIEPGSRIRVLRAAILGGPLHVELDSGVEAALDAKLARGARVERADPT